jgi:hypothetical protein
MLSDIKNEIRNIMNTVDDVYNIYVDKKYARETGHFLELFKSENISGEKMITAWFITRSSSNEEVFSNRENIRNHLLTISGYLGINENNNTSRRFEEIIEDICDAFRGNITLNNKCLEISPVQVEKVQDKYLGSILCHYAELKINCREKVLFLE